MPISCRSWRKPLVERFLSRIKVSLCWTSGWSTTVTPCIAQPPCLPAPHLAANGGAFKTPCRRWRPGSADRRPAAARGRGGAAEQRRGAPPPFDHQRPVDRVRPLRRRRVAQRNDARVDEQAAVAIFGKAGEAVDVGHVD